MSIATSPPRPPRSITDIVDRADARAWYQGALGELAPRWPPRISSRPGQQGVSISTELFTDERGQATIFLPCASVAQAGRPSAASSIPAAELATIVHPGSHTDLDRTYGALGAYVTRHALAVDGPIREYYLVGPLRHTRRIFVADRSRLADLPDPFASTVTLTVPRS